MTVVAMVMPYPKGPPLLTLTVIAMVMTYLWVPRFNVDSGLVAMVMLYSMGPPLLTVTVVVIVMPTVVNGDSECHGDDLLMGPPL